MRYAMKTGIGVVRLYKDKCAFLVPEHDRLGKTEGTLEKESHTCHIK